jgi:uncharacterized protein (DUF4415 family)
MHMPAKKRSVSSGLAHPDDAPELTADMLADAEVFKGEQFARRGPGRPKAEVTKEAISVRLDPDVLARLREGGPGWQSRINTVLRKALALRRYGRSSAGPRRLRDIGASSPPLTSAPHQLRDNHFTQISRIGMIRLAIASSKCLSR